MEALRPPTATPALAAVLARALAPRRVLPVSEWADLHLVNTSKSSAEPGRWVTARNPPLREPMDCFNLRSTVREVVLKFPIQFGKSEVLKAVCAYTMVNRPGPIMVTYPSEVSRDKGVNQKFQPLFESTPALRQALRSTNSRETANSRFFKDFEGGQWYAEHAGSPVRLKSTSVELLEVDELDEFAAQLTGGDDPLQMLNGRTSAFPATYRRLYVSTPQLKSTSRTEYLWERSDQRRYHVPCPHCGHRQHLEWSALQWSAHRHADTGRQVWLVCRECGAMIEERHKQAMIQQGQWVAANPGAPLRGYHINCLYYAPGLGPRWPALVDEWLDAQGDPARLKTFVNDRLAEAWEDAASRNVKANIVAERAEPYPLRTAPAGVLRITAGVDTQDNRLAVQIVGWGRGRAWWVLDYVELPGDPALDPVWDALTELLNRPIPHACGAQLSVEGVLVDAGGHRTEAVKAWVRDRRARRPMCAFGAVPNNAPVLSKGKPSDVNWRGQHDKRGVLIYHVGTVNVKHSLYAALAADADAQQAWEVLPDGSEKPLQPARQCHFSDQLPAEYFPGLISEVFNPAKNRFEKRRGGARNEPLDTWVYAFAAAQHPELRLHRATRADWDRWEQQLLARAPAAPAEAAAPGAPPSEAPAPQPAPKPGAWHSYRKGAPRRRN
jgi:phage terminase large subunit GpA-like protein